MSQMKKFLLYAVLPALIAGGFSIAPKVYDIVREPNARLNYVISKGPELQGQDGYRRIVSVVVTNTGKKPLHKVKAQLNLPSGTFEAVRLQDESGLNPDIKKTINEIHISADTVHPNEKFSIVAMALSSDNKVNEVFQLRSDEVLGVETKEKEGKKGWKELLGGISSGLSVLLMAAFFVSSRRIGSDGYGREDAIYYILMRNGLHALSDSIKFCKEGENITYLRTADILLDASLRGDSETKNKCIFALKCLLLQPNMAHTSRNAIVSNIKILSGDQFPETEIENIKARASSKLRENIDAYLENPASFLSNQA